MSVESIRWLTPLIINTMIHDVIRPVNDDISLWKVKTEAAVNYLNTTSKNLSTESEVNGEYYSDHLVWDSKQGPHKYEP